MVLEQSDDRSPGEAFLRVNAHLVFDFDSERGWLCFQDRCSALDPASQVGLEMKGLASPSPSNREG